MLENPDNLNKIVTTVKAILKADKLEELHEFLTNSTLSIEATGYDNWNGGLTLYTLYIHTELEKFIKIKDNLDSFEKALTSIFYTALRHVKDEGIEKILIVPNPKTKIPWSNLSGEMTKDQLINDLNFLKNTMVSVSTGGPSVISMNEEYKLKYKETEDALQKLDLKNPNPHKELHDWRGKWTSTFQTYAERKSYINDMYSALLNTLETDDSAELVSVSVDLSDWGRIERSIREIQLRQHEAITEEQFQSIGLLCRETIISLALAVYDSTKHLSLDGREISTTDAKRMLEAFIQVECKGSSNSALRKYARSTNDLANELTHKRTATERDMFLCVTATISLVNLIGIVSNKVSK